MTETINKEYNTFIFTLSDFKLNENTSFSKAITSIEPCITFQILLHEDQLKDYTNNKNNSNNNKNSPSASLIQSNNKSVSDFIQIQLKQIQKQHQSQQQQQNQQQSQQQNQNQLIQTSVKQDVVKNVQPLEKYSLIIHIFLKMLKSHQMIICQYKSDEIPLFKLFYIWQLILNSNVQKINETKETNEMYEYFPTYNPKFPINFDWSQLWCPPNVESSIGNTVWQWISFPERNWISLWKNPQFNCLLHDRKKIGKQHKVKWLKVINMDIVTQAATQWQCTIQELILLSLLGTMYTYFINPKLNNINNNDKQYCPTAVKILLHKPQPYAELVEHCQQFESYKIPIQEFISCMNVKSQYIPLQLQCYTTITERIADLRCKLMEQINSNTWYNSEDLLKWNDITLYYQHLHSPFSFPGLHRIKKLLFFPQPPKSNIPITCCSIIHGSYLSITLLFSKYKIIDIDYFSNLLQQNLNSLLNISFINSNKTCK